MMINKDIKYIIKNIILRAACLMMAALIASVMLPADTVFADTGDTAQKKAEEPIREVHKVGVGSKLYCFFVTHNVVFTPAEIEGLSDEELSAEILKRSGLYMKETNCNKPSHTAVTPEAWDKDKWHLYISDTDIEELRSAEPVEGEPVKLHMDVRVKDKTADEEAEEVYYSTFKRLSPRIIFIAVATEEDAALGEDICEEEQPAPAKQEKKKKTKKQPSIKDGGGGEAEEMLPEYRTISMTDRSGGPLEETLKDGTPVTLEWIEPDRHAKSDAEKTFLDHIPGRAYGLAAGIAVVAALIAFAAVRKKRGNE